MGMPSGAQDRRLGVKSKAHWEFKRAELGDWTDGVSEFRLYPWANPLSGNHLLVG